MCAWVVSSKGRSGLVLVIDCWGELGVDGHE